MPASMMSIMNGAQRHTTMMMIDSIGYSANQSMRGPPSDVMTQSTTPKTGLSIMFFQPSAPTTGITRNGVMSIVRTMPRPGKRWLTSSAKKRPNSNDRMTAEHVRKTVL